jgi:tryptophan 7-halogenase
MAKEPLKSILIVGGGTAGWMTAALLNRFIPASRCAITLVESPDVGTIGVGEATVPPLVAFMRAIGVDEDEFLRECQATFKLGIKFIDWRRKGSALWHPFGAIGGSIDRIPLFQHWLKAQRSGTDPSSFDSYSLHALLGEQGKAPRPLGGSSPITDAGQYAYHLDAKAFAAYLARIACYRGVVQVLDTVRGVALDQRGSIDRIETERHGALQADLYIDCTGFAGLLIERALGDPYIDWSDLLLCDRALAMQLPHDGHMAPYTRATALDAGWVWRIPLHRRIGSGYVFSSRFISEEAAAREFLLHAGQDPERAEPRLLKMRVGRRTSFWVRNCVAVGLASGFLEPLESTGIFLIQKGIEHLLEGFPDCGLDDKLRRRYNRRMGELYEEVRDFIVMHYLLTERVDTEFWKANRALVAPDSLEQALALFDETGLVDWDDHALFGDNSFHALAAGFGRLPRRHHPMSDYSDSGRVGQIMAGIKAQQRKFAEGLPDHGDFVRSLLAGAAPAVSQ